MRSDRLALAVRVTDLMRTAALAGKPAPKNEEIAARLGFQSGYSAVRALAAAVEAGFIVVARGQCARVVADAAGTWRTAGAAGRPHWRDRA